MQSAEDMGINLVDVTVPVGFEVKNLIKQWEAQNPDGIVLTQETLSEWAERSGLQKRPANNPNAKAAWGIACLDTPMSVFPMLLRGGRNYLLSLVSTHNLHPAQRIDVHSKLNHGLNVRMTGIVSVDDLIHTVDNNTPVSAAVREFYDHLAMPSLGEPEGFDKVVYLTKDEKLSKLSQEQLAELCLAKFTAWKKDCKLKSKVTDLKKGPFFSKTMDAFNRRKRFQHKSTAVQARAEWEKEQETKKSIKAAAKAKKEQEKKDAIATRRQELQEAGLEGAELEEQVKQHEEECQAHAEAEEDEEVDELPPVLEEFSEEDWMLAGFRAEVHARIHFFFSLCGFCSTRSWLHCSSIHSKNIFQSCGLSRLTSTTKNESHFPACTSHTTTSSTRERVSICC